MYTKDVAYLNSSKQLCYSYIIIDKMYTASCSIRQ